MKSSPGRHRGGQKMDQITIEKNTKNIQKDCSWFREMIVMMSDSIK